SIGRSREPEGGRGIEEPRRSLCRSIEAGWFGERQGHRHRFGRCDYRRVHRTSLSPFPELWGRRLRDRLPHGIFLTKIPPIFANPNAPFVRLIGSESFDPI